MHPAARIILDDKVFTPSEFIILGLVEDWIKPIQDMVSFCMGDKEYYTFHTSGSTGIPKEIEHSRQMLEASAKATLDYFSLRPGDRALLVLPAQYIGGAMMVLRACLGGLELVLQEPKARPALPDNLAFVPLTPAQYIAIEQVEGWDTFSGVVLLGGSSLPALYDVPVEGRRVYVGYGMTETASHVALRNVGDSVYEGVGETSFWTNQDSHLVITAPHLGIDQLITEDLVQVIGQKTFRYLGRSGWVINAGGVKIHPTHWEQFLSKRGIEAIMVPIPDEYFGQVPVLVVSQRTMLKNWPIIKKDWSTIPPKWAIVCRELPTVGQGKVNRKGLEDWVRSHQDLLFPLE